ncbi:MAG: hypothetical protein OXG35_05770 [Acidobacteria bacterium]|nr:hypothetical protein [Acidobacteriota bacterium]
MGSELVVAFLSGSVAALVFALWIVVARARLFRFLFWGAVLVGLLGGWLVWSGALGSVPGGGSPAGFEETARPR